MKEFDVIRKIESKIAENKIFLKYTYYELRVKENLTENEMYGFIGETINELKKRKYEIYRTRQKYIVNKQEYVVKDNELLVAIKKIGEREIFRQYSNKFFLIYDVML